MIVDLILKIFYYVLFVLISLLPASSVLPVEISNGFLAFATTFNKINSIFPLDTLFLLFSLFISIESGILLFKLFNWAINKFRGSG